MYIDNVVGRVREQTDAVEQVLLDTHVGGLGRDDRTPVADVTVTTVSLHLDFVGGETCQTGDVVAVGGGGSRSEGAAHRTILDVPAGDVGVSIPSDGDSLVLDISGVQTGRDVARLYVVRQRGEGHFITVNSSTVEGDECLVGVTRVGGQAGEVVGEVVARHRHRLIGAASGSLPFEALGRDGHVVRIGDGTVQGGGGLSDSGCSCGSHRRIGDHRTRT